MKPISQEGWKDFWEWSVRTLLPRIQLEAGRKRVVPHFAHIEKAELRPIKGELVEAGEAGVAGSAAQIEELVFTVSYKAGAGNSPLEVQRFQYLRGLASKDNRSGGVRCTKLSDERWLPRLP